MILRSWFLAVRDAFRSMTQSSLMSLASVATVAVSLLVLSVVLLLALNLEFMATTVEQQVEIKAYVCAPDEIEGGATTCAGEGEITPERVQEMMIRARQIPGVLQAKLISREEALERMKEQFGEQRDILEGFEGENPLRDSIEVKTIEADDVRLVATELAQIPGISDVIYGQEYVDKLLAFTHAVRLGGTGLVMLLIVATVLTISNTIRLAVYARRREISIMKLVGATDWYIRRPFMVEGIFLGVLGALVAMGFTGTGYIRLVGYLHEQIQFLPVVAPEEVLMSLTLALTLLGAVLGALGSLISMRRFLKV